jgi:hypothetical protein
MDSIAVSVDAMINGQWCNLLWKEGKDAVGCRPTRTKIEQEIAKFEKRGFNPRSYKVETMYRLERRVVVEVYELWHDLVSKHERTLV